MSAAGIDLGRYQLGRILGSGGMAIVYLADDRELGRPVAVKLLADNLAADPAFRARFLREAQLAARLSHPQIVHVYDIGREPGGRPFIVMEYVEGESLAQTLAREGSLPARRVLAIAGDCCAGLIYAHAAGLVHRDLKPHNLLVGADGRVKIADFGVARSLDGAAFTQTGSVLGTAGYLAPEQARGEPVTAAADIYGLGVTLHQLATGRMPAPGTPLELPESLRGAVARALDADPARRPTAPELARMLAAETSPVTPARSGTATGATLVQAGAALASDATLIQAGPSPAATAPPRVHGHDRRARRRWLAALLAVLALAVVVALAAGHGGGASTPPPRHHARQRTVPAIPTGATPAAQARLLARWLRDRAG